MIRPETNSGGGTIRRAIGIACGLCLLLQVGCSDVGKPIPPKALEALQGAQTFELFALDPLEVLPADGTSAGNDDGSAAKPADDVPLFQQWKIEQSVTIDDPDERQALITALQRGVAENDGMVAACFNPRHAIRVTFQGKTYEFVICFECLSVKWNMVGGPSSGSFLTTNSPAAKFNAVLAKHKSP